MQILVPFLIVSFILGFHKGFHKFMLVGVVLMDCLSFLKYLALDYELGCGGFLFGRFKQVYRFLGLFLLFGFGLKFMLSENCCSAFVRFLCGLSGKSENWFCSKNVIDRKFSKVGSSVPFNDGMEMEKIGNMTDFDGEIKIDSENEDDEDDDVVDDDGEFDITTSRELLKIERQKVNAARAELAKERAASATAAEEAMAMILRLQNEKSLIEMEWSQHRRLAEEKQIHDQEVIRSLQWLVRQHEFDRCLLEEAEFEEAQSSINGNIIDALENVLYSSRDSD